MYCFATPNERMLVESTPYVDGKKRLEYEKNTNVPCSRNRHTPLSGDIFFDNFDHYLQRLHSWEL